MFQLKYTTWRKLLVLGILIAGVFSGLILVDLWQKQEQKKDLRDSEILKTEKEKIVTFREALDEEEKPTIVYRYISEAKAEAETYQGLTEDMSKRTDNSQTFLKKIEPISETEQKETYIAKFYAGQTFEKEEDDWKYVETATTTKEAFFKQTKLTMLDKAKELLGQKVLAETFWSGTGDGRIANADGLSSWSTGHDATTADDTNYTDTTAHVYVKTTSYSTFTITRAFLPVETSTLPDNAFIISAALNIYLTGIFDNNNDGNDFITVVQTTQASNTELIDDDYDQCGDISNPTEGIDASERKDFTTLSANQYLAFNLNSTGFGWIKKNGESSTCGLVGTTGITCLGIREGHDALNIAPSTAGQTGITGIQFYTSEQTDTSQDPYLEITYETVNPTTIQIDGGTIELDGGTIQIN